MQNEDYFFPERFSNIIYEDLYYGSNKRNNQTLIEHFSELTILE